MSQSNPRQIFLDRPGSSAVLALLLVFFGLAFVNGWVEDSPNRRYFPGHHWVIASLGWTMAVYLAYCAGKGFLLRIRRKQP